MSIRGRPSRLKLKVRRPFVTAVANAAADTHVERIFKNSRLGRYAVHAQGKSADSTLRDAKTDLRRGNGAIGCDSEAHHEPPPSALKA